jgi:lipid-binding SYLF domain-containing protein
MEDVVMSRSHRIALALSVAGAALVLSTGRIGAAPNDEIKRINESISVMRDLTATPDQGIPRHLLQRAEAIVVIPDLMKGGFIVGAKHGRGVLSVRDSERRWSAPAFMKMTGGSIGWQIGVESVDVVFLVMNRGGIDDILSDKFTLGGNMAVAAGPVGRNADAATDVKLGSSILAYSRAKGLFAGASFEGASLSADKDADESFYGSKSLTTRDIIQRPPSSMPQLGSQWRTTLHDITEPGK